MKLEPVLLGHAGLGAWTFDPLAAAGLALAAIAYARRARSLAARGRRPSVLRCASFLLGLVALALALFSPLAHVAGESLLTAHMTQHLLVGDVAPLLVVVGLTGPMLRPLLALSLARRLRGLAHPLVAIPVWAANLLVWHVPALYEAALVNDAVHALEHTLFFSTGAFMWAALLEPVPGPAWFGPAAKAISVLAIRAVGAALGNALFWADRAFYETYGSGERPGGLAAVEDQNLAGAVMLVEGGVVTLAAFAWFFLRWEAQAEARQRLVEGGVEPEAAARRVRYGRAPQQILQIGPPEGRGRKER